MKLSRAHQVLFGASVQFLILFAMIGYKMLILGSGTDVLLRIAPVDPRDPLRGDYVTFQYDISRIPGFYLNRGDSSAYSTLEQGDVVYVALSQSGVLSEVKAVYLEKPADELALKAVVRSVRYEEASGRFDSDSRRVGSRGNTNSRQIQELQVSYGAEEYFIPEGTGQGVRFPEGSAFARLKVDENGNSVLRQIYLNGKPWP